MKKLTLTSVIIIFVNIICAQNISVDLKVFLEGPFNGTDMNTELYNAGLLPLTQPYNTEPWNYEGIESVGTIPNDNIVDWILVEIRETEGDATTASDETIIAKQAGFLLKDGNITSMDGINPMQFSITMNYSLYAVIYHRNHLPIMTASELLLDNGNYTWDFTTGEGQVYENFNTKIIESENFIYSWGDWTTYNVIGDQVWSRNNNYGEDGTPCAAIDGYEGGFYENDNWLISPPLDLDNFTDVILTFQNSKNYDGPDISLKVSTDYSGTGLPFYANWITIPFTMSPGEWVWTSAGEISLAAITGQNVYIAFHYTSTLTESASWDIDDIEITGTGQIFSELGHKELNPGVWGMISGDGSTNYKIDFVDKANSWATQAGGAGYLFGDYDLNGENCNIDKNEYWRINNGRSTHVIMPWYCDMPFRDTRDGKVYNSVKIGTQCWMAENLNIGVMISGINDMTDNSVLEKYCYNDIEDNCNEYGGLYQWDETMQYTTVQGVQGICPEGWHVPTKDEFNILFSFLGGGINGGGKLKESGTNHWDTPNYGATNESGFFAFGMGNRNPNGSFNSMRHSGYYFTSLKEGDYFWIVGLQYFSEDISQVISDENYGDGVRCLKD